MYFSPNMNWDHFELEMSLCIKVLITNVNWLHYHGMFHYLLRIYFMYFGFNFLSYSLVLRSKLFNTENDIWNCHLVLNGLWGYSWVVFKTEWILRNHTFLSFYEFEECLKNVCSYALKIHTMTTKYGYVQSIRFYKPLMNNLTSHWKPDDTFK